MRVVELFAGIGAQRQALEELGIEHEAIVCEIDKHAYRAYCAIHGDTPNLGDITKVERLPPCDLLTYSFPCQDLSVAGCGRGMSRESGTRSSLLWEVERLLRVAQENDELPDALLMENVDAILNKDNIRDFREWVRILSEMGYISSYKVLNAKDFGIPQNRRRCFMISRRDGGSLDFPDPILLTTRLKDYLEEDVPDRFFLSDEKIETYERHRIRHEAQGHGFGWSPTKPDGVIPPITTNPTRHGAPFLMQAGDLKGRPKVDVGIIRCGSIGTGGYDHAKRVYLPEGLAPTLTTKKEWAPKIEWPCATKRGFMTAEDGDGLVMAGPTLARGTVQNGSAPTLTTGKGCDTGVVDGLSVRFLTPRECWRLMGFPDDAYDKAERECSQAQLYHQAGNSIVVNVLKAIFSKMYLEPRRQKSLLDW